MNKKNQLNNLIFQERKQETLDLAWFDPKKWSTSTICSQLYYQCLIMDDLGHYKEFHSSCNSLQFFSVTLTHSQPLSATITKHSEISNHFANSQLTSIYRQITTQVSLKMTISF